MSQRYEIREEIGKGGLGAVYKAFDTQLHREVAMKRVLTTEHATEEEVQSSASKLIAEAKTLSSLNHPNIVTVFDVGQDEKGGFVVMELLKGETLDETVSRGVLTQEDFIEIVTQTMEALIAAQASDVIHRDLKPTNVMVIWQPSGKFQTKILDFGLAKFSRAPSVQTMDQEDAVMGSIYFMAPEQFERSELDARTDLYQIGCVYYHALTGHYPFRGETAPQVMNAHLQHRVTPLDQLRPDLSPSICQWIMWLINREMENRPADAREALERFPRHPEPAHAPPVLQAIPVEEAAPPASSAPLLVKVPSRGAAPPAKTRTGSAPVARRGASGPVKRGHTGSTPIRGARGRTGPVYPAEERSRSTLFLVIGGVAAIVLAVGGWAFWKSSQAAGERARIAQLASQEAPAGTPADVDLAVKILGAADASTEEKALASKVLATLSGAGVDRAIITSLEASDSPFVRLRLSQAASEREIGQAVPAMMAAVRATGSDSQKAELLQHVRRVASRESLASLLDSLGGSHSPAVRTLFEDTILAVLRRQPVDSSSTAPLLGRLAATSGEERISLFRVLGALGTGDVLARLRAIHGGGEEDRALRLDSMAALLKWPDLAVLPLLEEILASGADNSFMIPAARAYARAAGLPTPVPLEERLQAWRFGMEHIARAQELSLLFAGIADQTAPEAVALLEEAKEDPRLASLAAAALEQSAQRTQNAVAAQPGELLPASSAVIAGDDAQGAAFNPAAEALVGWRSPDTWFLWHFTVPESGAYTFSVMQSYADDDSSEFEIIAGGRSLPGSSAETAPGVFAPATTSGSVTLEAGPVHVLALRARGVVQPRLMDVSGILVERE